MGRQLSLIIAIILLVLGLALVKLDRSEPDSKSEIKIEKDS